MGFFEEHFPDVRDMLEADVRANQAAQHKPWRLTTLELGHRVVMSSHDSEAEAQAALASVLRTCAPFIRDTFRIEHVSGR